MRALSRLKLRSKLWLIMALSLLPLAFLAVSYGNVNMHEGRPTASQLNRMATLGAQLDAAVALFEKASKR